MGRLCKEDGFWFNWDPFIEKPVLTLPDASRQILCETSFDNTPLISGIRFRFLPNVSAPDSEPVDSAADHNAAPSDPPPAIADDGMGIPLPVDECPMPPVFEDANPELVSEVLRRDQRNLIYRPVPQWVDDIDTFFYDKDSHLILSLIHI